jgi:copper chaperone CopZ
MKTFIAVVIIIITVGLIRFSIVTRQTVPKPKSELKTSSLEPNQPKNLRQATLKIGGMFCASCATGAEYALKEKKGVVSASVDYDSESGKVIYDPSKISKEELIQAVKPYTAVIIEDRPLK